MSEHLWSTGVLLILAGFLFVFIATILLVFRSLKIKGKVKGGGAIIIGPFPIVFGTDKESVKMLLILSIILVGLLLIFMVFSYFLYK
jgi:uncharacterized protein (TIGR00304 family)